MTTQYQVGQAIMQPSADSVRFDLSDDGAILVIAMRNLSDNEKQSFKNGAHQFKFAIANDIIFLLCRFGTMQWMDAPYYKFLSRPFHIDPPKSGMGIAMHALLVEATTGVLVAQKLIGLSHDLSVKLLEAVDAQPEIHDYSMRLSTTLRLYSTVDLLEQSAW